MERSAVQPVDDLVPQTLARGLPPQVGADMPLLVQAELEAMAHLSDTALGQC